MAGLYSAAGLSALLFLGACGSESGSEITDSGDATQGAGESDSDLSPDEAGDSDQEVIAGNCEQYRDFRESEGTQVSIAASLTDVELTAFEEAWNEFEECTGIDIVVQEVNQVDSYVLQDLGGVDSPDMAWTTRYPTLRALVDSGIAVPAPASVGNNVDLNWNPGWKAAGSVGGEFYAAPLGANLHSLIWFNPQVFSDRDYLVPERWDEVWALSDQMASDDLSPWCAGLVTGAGDGMPATTWLSDLMIRLFGEDVYDQWVNHDLVFESPETGAAMDVLAGWMRNPEYVNGGIGDPASVATSSWSVALESVRDGTCGMLPGLGPDKGASSDIAAAEAAGLDAYFLPGLGVDTPSPAIVSSRFAVSLADRPEVSKVQAFLAGTLFNELRVAAGDWVSGNKAVALSDYAPGSVESLAADIVTSSDSVVRLNGADAMPTEIGQVVWPQAMVTWFEGEADTATVLSTIDAAW